MKYFFHRGLVRKVECTLAEFIGMSCGRCAGTGTLEPVYSRVVRRVALSARRNCPDCVAGTLPGALAAVFGAQPVTGVRLTDRERRNIVHYTEDDSGVVGWTDDDEWRHRPSWLPAELWAHLPPGELDLDGYRCWFREGGATAALDSACVAHGRDLAGLPALTPPSAPARR